MSRIKITIDLSDYTLEQLDMFLLEGVISVDEYQQELNSRAKADDE